MSLLTSAEQPNFMHRACSYKSSRTLRIFVVRGLGQFLGRFHFLGFPDRINGPMFCTSKIISCVVASVAEAELGAAFQNAQKAAEFRSTLQELGYPQEPAMIMIDYTVAEGLAADTVNAKRSKSMDVRFFWLRDRIQKA